MASKAQKPQDRLTLDCPTTFCSVQDMQRAAELWTTASPETPALAVLSGQVPERGLALCTPEAVFSQSEDRAPAYLTKGATGGSDGLRVCVREGSLEETRG